MIHQLLILTRPLFVLDCETTGTNPKTARIVELGFQQWTAEGLIREWRSLIDPGVPIPTSTTKVHGIANLDMHRCQTCMLIIDDVAPDRCRCSEPKPPLTFKQLAANLARGFSDCDFAGKKVRFDLSVIGAEMHRAGVSWDYSTARIIDTDRLEQLAVPRSLTHLHEKYTGQPHDQAHAALSDVRATTTVIVGQLQMYPSLPRDLDELHKAQWSDWLCAGGEFRILNGIPTCQFGKHRGTPMKNIPTSYYDWILTADFPADVKALARDAKLGKFPDEIE